MGGREAADDASTDNLRMASNMSPALAWLIFTLDAMLVTVANGRSIIVANARSDSSARHQHRWRRMSKRLRRRRSRAPPVRNRGDPARRAAAKEGEAEVINPVRRQPAGSGEQRMCRQFLGVGRTGTRRLFNNSWMWCRCRRQVGASRCREEDGGEWASEARFQGLVERAQR